MYNLINVNENGEAWIECDDQVYGIVNAVKILDFDGLTFTDQSVCDLLDCDQNYDLECNEITFKEENGETSVLRIYQDHIELIDLDNNNEVIYTSA